MSQRLKHLATRWSVQVRGLIGVGCVGLVGCEERLSGQYVEVNGWGRMEFHEQTVYVTVAIVGSTFAATYDVEGDDVIIDGAAGSQLFHIQSDGDLHDGKGLRFVRQ